MMWALAWVVLNVVALVVVYRTGWRRGFDDCQKAQEFARKLRRMHGG